MSSLCNVMALPHAAETAFASHSRAQFTHALSTPRPRAYMSATIFMQQHALCG
jgi:hypothetical protein